MGGGGPFVFFCDPPACREVCGCSRGLRIRRWCARPLLPRYWGQPPYSSIGRLSPYWGCTVPSIGRLPPHWGKYVVSVYSTVQYYNRYWPSRTLHDGGMLWVTTNRHGNVFHRRRCVCSWHKTVLSTRRHLAHSVSLLILHPILRGYILIRT